VITFQVEKLADVKDEVLPLLRLHWDEIALNKDTVPLDIDWEMYQRIEGAGGFCAVTMRDDGVLGGYAAYCIGGSLHYRSLKIAESDIFYIHPDHRRGLLAVSLFREAEKTVKALGCNKIVNKVKLHFDVGPLFERMGYAPIERLYAKSL